jgi:hypothetical protein
MDFLRIGCGAAVGEPDIFRSCEPDKGTAVCDLWHRVLWE